MAILSKSQMLTMFHMSEGVLKKYIDEGLPYQLQGRSKVFDEEAVTTHIREKQAALEAQLVIGKEYSNAEISNIFHGNEQRGMKKSNSFNALVLLSTHESDNLYDDYWDGNILYYTGMGFDGDQRLDFYENKTLAESNQNGVTVYLFEGFEHHDYFYRGIVRLKGAPFQKEEKDQSGSLRKVWKFPLELCSSNSYLGQEIITEEHEDKISAAKRLGTETLRKKAEDAYVFSEGPIPMIDEWDAPARTMLTSEGSFNRSTHIVRDKVSNRIRILTPIETERIQGFPDDWTKECLMNGAIKPMTERMRYFCMGNALVVNLIAQMEPLLCKIIDNE